MAYVALYRKWRPHDFTNLIGQDHISTTLSNAIVQGKVAHAYLFSGPRGTGKTSSAQILAKALNCEHGPTPTPCNKCSACIKINEGSFMDVFEIDAASNRGIDEIRELRETVKFAPVDGRYKVYIIDEVHMLTMEAFNALLKTLEEPPSHVVFILATTEIHKVPITIQSRCQRYDFKRITSEEIQARLERIVHESNLDVASEVLHLISLQAAGGMRDALSLLDQCLAFATGRLDIEQARKVLGLIGNENIEKLMDAIIQRNTGIILEQINDVLISGKEPEQFINELVLYLRTLLIYKVTHNVASYQLYMVNMESLERQATSLDERLLQSFIQDCLSVNAELKSISQPRITLEVLLLRLAARAGGEEPSKPQLQLSNPATSTSAETSTNLNIIDNLQHKLSQLEQHLAQLEAKIALVPANNPGIPMPIRPKNIVKPKKQLPTSAAPVSSIQYSREQMLSIWNKVLQALKRQGKTVMLACVDKATPYNLVNDQLFINFTSQFLKSRTDKSDYKDALEQALLEITQQPIQVITTADSTVPVIDMQLNSPEAELAQSYMDNVPPPTDEDFINTHHIDYASIPDEGRHALEKAIEIFGGEVIPKDD